MNGRALYWGLIEGQQIQDKLANRAYSDVGEEYWHDQRNRGEIPPIELHHGGTCDPIMVDIYTTRHLGHGGGGVCRSGEYDPGNIFSSSFL